MKASSTYLYLALLSLFLSLPTTTRAHTAVLFGSSGAVGSEVLKALLANNGGFWKEIIVVARRFPTHIDINSVRGDVKVRQVKLQDLSKIHQDERFMDADPVDACFNCIGVGNPYEHNLQYWYSTEVELTEAIAKLCGNQLQSKHISLLSAVDAEEDPKPMDKNDADFQKDAPAMGWWGMLRLYAQMKGLAEQAISSVEKNGLPLVRIFQPSNLVTPTIRYGWLDWTLFKVLPYLDPLLPQRYHSVPVQLLGMAMVEDAREVLLGISKNTSDETRVTRLLYEDYIRLAGVPYDIVVEQQKQQESRDKEL